ncbi:MAG: ComF family protein [Microvirga sp.]|nr:ComF family protein [Microvirga sp.]
MKVCLKALDGVWTRGVALDKHKIRSTYTGDNEFGHPQFETERTEIGEALFQLKYRKAWSHVPALAAALYEHAVPNFPEIDFVLPVPPSTYRARQPVTELARAVANLLSVPCIENLLTSNAGSSLKDEKDREKKLALLAGRLVVDDILPDGKSNLLLIDDLFDTGATLEAACSMLRTYPKVAKIYVATLTWT